MDEKMDSFLVKKYFYYTNGNIFNRKYLKYTLDYFTLFQLIYYCNAIFN